MAALPRLAHNYIMWHRRLAYGGFLIGVILALSLLNSTPESQGALAKLAEASSLPLLLVLSPVLFLLSIGGGGFTVHAVCAVLTWTAAGFAAGYAADGAAHRRVFATKRK